MKKRLRLLVLLLPLLAAGAAYFLWARQPRTVDVASARLGPATELVYATGFVEAEQPVSVAARLTAPVTDVLVREGDHVLRGQPLLLLEDAQQPRLHAQAAAEARRAALNEGRLTTLYREGWVTRAARDEAVAAADAARAGERAAAARAGQLVVRAGIGGIVLKRDVEPGDLAIPSRVLMTLGDPGRIRITATVDERDVPRIDTGQKVLMRSDAWPGRAIRGHVREITPGGDPAQRAFRARIALDEGARLPIGLTLEVNIVTRRDDRTVLAPNAALAGDGAWTVEDGRARRLRLASGIAGSDATQILSGLQPGQVLILNPGADLREGERVRVRAARR